MKIRAACLDAGDLPATLVWHVEVAKPHPTPPRDRMPTHYQGSDIERTALDTYIKFLRAAESVTHELTQSLAEFNLTISQFGTLEVIYHLGPMCQKAIGEKLLKSGGNITMVVNNLEDRDLVTRKRRESDRRYVSVELTEEGRALIEEVLPHHVNLITEAFGVLSRDEQMKLGALCKKVGMAAAGIPDRAGLLDKKEPAEDKPEDKGDQQ